MKRVALAVVAVLFTGACAASGPSTGASATQAPDFTVETFEGSTLREQRGTPVVLNFWESW